MARELLGGRRAHALDRAAPDRGIEPERAVGKATLVEGERWRSARAPGRETLVMRSAERDDIDERAEELLEQARGPGAPLEAALQRRLEAALRAPLDGVRVHTDVAADAAARAFGARAFAIRQDVFFRSGAYDPHGADGQRLIAHEVAHTVQAHGPSTGGLSVSAPTDAPEREADAFADAFARGAEAPMPRAGLSSAVHRDVAADVHAVKSKEIEHAEGQETTDWPGVVARQKNRQKDIEDTLKLKLKAPEKTALDRMHARWGATPLVDASFDPISGALDDKALRALLAEERVDAAALTGKRFASIREWTKKLIAALGAFLTLRTQVTQEQTQFQRFDDAFLDPDVTALLAKIPGGFTPAHLKAMLAQETGDFTDTNIAGLEGKTEGIVHALKPNPSFVGIGQVKKETETDARAMAAKLKIALPAERTGKDDPRRTPASGIKLAAAYLAYIGDKLDTGLPAKGRPAGAEMRKLVLAAYNGGPFGLIKAAGEIAPSAYPFSVLSKNDTAMAHFLKPGEVRDYVKRVTERAP